MAAALPPTYYTLSAPDLLVRAPKAFGFLATVGYKCKTPFKSTLQLGWALSLTQLPLTTVFEYKAPHVSLACQPFLYQNDFEDL